MLSRLFARRAPTPCRMPRHPSGIPLLAGAHASTLAAAVRAGGLRRAARPGQHWAARASASSSVSSTGTTGATPRPPRRANAPRARRNKLVRAFRRAEVAEADYAGRAINCL